MARADVLQALLEAASEQGGYVTAAQATRLGIEPYALTPLVSSGDLRRVRRGVYAMRHANHRLEDEIAAWLSVDRDRLPWERRDEAAAVVSHASAAGAHGLGTVIAQLPSLTVPPTHRSASRGKAIELHVAPLGRADWEWLRDEDVSLPVTTPARTIVDLLLANEERSYLERSVREAMTEDDLTRDDLIATARRRRRRSASLVRGVSSLLDDASR
jgi:predicted transcriptional regulator of viral defense system